MGQILHKRAKKTHAIRDEIQRSMFTIQELSARYNINLKTVLKWKHRTSVEDASMDPRRLRTVLSEQEEAIIICALRQKTLLPLDDCFIALKEQIPQLTPTHLHRYPGKESLQEIRDWLFSHDICEAHTRQSLFIRGRGSDL